MRFGRVTGVKRKNDTVRNAPTERGKAPADTPTLETFLAKRPRCR